MVQNHTSWEASFTVGLRKQVALFQLEDTLCTDASTVVPCDRIVQGAYL